MSNDPPELLWKYRPWNAFTDAMIRHGELYYPSIEELNDPFEFRWHERFPTDPGEADLFIRELLAKNFPDDDVPTRAARHEVFKADYHSITARYQNGVGPRVDRKFAFGVFCAAQSFKDLLMWSHYADHHRGICVAIRATAVKPKAFLPVIYSKTVPVFNIWGYVFENRENFVRLSRMKSESWRYEQEWRTVDHLGARRFPNCVAKVVIGSRVSSEHRSEILAAVEAADCGIEVLQAKLSDRMYALEFEPLIHSIPNPHRPRRGASRRRGPS